MSGGQRSITKTGGRGATMRHIPGDSALSVGVPNTPPPKGWVWTRLSDVARLESGHTPSRKHPEYWQGQIPWISLTDARPNHGGVIKDTAEHTNDLGISNSSARVLPKNTVCLSRTASVGYIVVMGRDMATSQDFVNWVCSKKLNHNFLKYILLAESGAFRRFSSGSVHQTIYFPEVKAFYVCLPPLPEQHRIVAILDEAFKGFATARANAEKNLTNAREIFESYLQDVFTQRVDGCVETTLGQATNGVFTGPFGSLLHKSDYIENGIPLVNPTHITDTGIEPDLRKTVSQATADRLSHYIMREGYIVIGRRGEMGRCALVTKAEDGWLCGTGSFFIKPSGKCDMRYLVRFLRSHGCKKQMEKIAGGTVMPNLSNVDLSEMHFDLPPIKRQKVIIQEIDNLSEDVRRLESLYKQKIAALDELKKALLYKAFNGEL